MPIISFIPESYESGFKALESMSDRSFAELREALMVVSMSASTDDLATKIARTKGLDLEELKEIFSSLGGLTSFLEKESDIDEIVQDLVSLSLNDWLKPESEDKFRDRLSHLLKNKKIFYTSKAEDLLTETENLFLACKVSTDIRPIFNVNVNENPEAGLIIHNLHIHYQGNLSSQHKDIYLSLNSYDIQTLIQTLIRAVNKEESLHKLLERSGITYLND